MRTHTARQILSDRGGETARKIASARKATPESVKVEAEVVLRKANKRERQRKQR